MISARRRRSGNSQPQDLRRCAMELSGRLGYALKQPGGDESKAKDLVTRIYKNTKVLDSARGAPPPRSSSGASVTY